MVVANRAFQFWQKAGMQGAASPLPEREVSSMRCSLVAA